VTANGLVDKYSAMQIASGDPWKIGEKHRQKRNWIAGIPK